MIGKISMGGSFRGCIRYCLEDKVNKDGEVVFQNRAELLLYNQCYGNKPELIEQFNDVRALNQKVQKPVLHIALSLALGEQLEKEKLREMAEQCARAMGFERNQYIAVAHSDTGHLHVHIVANRVGFDGRVVSDSNNYKKIAEYCRNMELKYGLKQVLSPKRYLSKEQRQLPRLDTRKEKLKEVIRECLSTAKTYKAFEEQIKARGYEVIKGRGIAFVDQQAVKVKGSELGYSLQKIERILEWQGPLQQEREKKLSHEQSRPIKQGQQQRPPLHRHQELDGHYPKEKETFLADVAAALLKPIAADEVVPYPFKHSHKEEKKKKKRKSSQHL